MYILIVCSFVIIIFVDHETWAATDFCSISSCDAGQHSMCLYPSSSPSSQCEKYVPASFTSDEMTSLVNRHNELRAKIASGSETRGNPGPQPSASNMKRLKWDNELAQVAQRYADQCISGHDKCRNVERFSVGQNIATFWNSGTISKSISEAVDEWYNEVDMFNMHDVAKYKFDSSTGHYTQLVWANTEYVGCGRVRFWDSEQNMNCLRIICNYGAAGNFIGEPMYATGGPDSACASTVTNSSSRLCKYRLFHLLKIVYFIQ